MTNKMTIQADFTEVVEHIRQARQKAYTQINTTLIELYWNVGRIISQKVKSSNWGKGVVGELASFITQNDSTIKGFSDKNLWRMKQFYETYHDDEKLSPMVRELPWTHNTIIFSRSKTTEEREFYLEALDRDVKKSHENPSIGVLLCKDKDDEVVEYAMSRHLSPTLVSHYTTMLPDKKILQIKLHEITEMLESQNEQ